MTIIAAIPVLVFVAGLILYFWCNKISKQSAGEIGKWMFVVGLLVWLMGAGAQSCSGGVANGGGSSGQHH